MPLGTCVYSWEFPIALNQVSHCLALNWIRSCSVSHYGESVYAVFLITLNQSLRCSPYDESYYTVSPTKLSHIIVYAESVSTVFHQDPEHIAPVESAFAVPVYPWFRFCCVPHHRIRLSSSQYKVDPIVSKYYEVRLGMHSLHPNIAVPDISLNEILHCLHTFEITVAGHR
jgi:hypothetical protein